MSDINNYGDVMKYSNQLQREETNYYPTLGDGYVSSIDKKMNLRFRVEHEFSIDEEWVYDMMMNDNDVINSEFYQIIKDKKVKVKLNDWGEWDELIIDEHTCSVDEYDGIKIWISETDLWLRLKRKLFGSHYEGDVRTLVGDNWYINQGFTEKDYENDVKIEFNLEEEIEKLKSKN